ncbi:hypothetical protein [uncultured Desulfobacter sp.]|uniref:hypothetical protein n=1 Tax=uncultured Desulfobacter sp. TaxID=240139 RepID=UPI002AAB1712|nr:hypothetical protein [uncultured Desulfobacter sp.]
MIISCTLTEGTRFKREWSFFIQGGDTVLPSYLDLDTEIPLFPELEAFKYETQELMDLQGNLTHSLPEYNAESRQVKKGLNSDTGTSLREISRTVVAEVERYFETKVNPGTIKERARRTQAGTNVPPVENLTTAGDEGGDSGDKTTTPEAVAAVKREVEKGTPARKVAEETRIEADEFVKNITIRYENDSQISIQQKRKAKVNVEMTALGFRESGKGGERKTWDNFIAVLQNPPNYYWYAPEQNDKQQVYNVNKKLLKFLSTTFSVNFSDGFKLIERVSGAGKGIYGFNCKIEYKDTEDIGSKDKNSFRDLFFSTVEKWEKAFTDKEKNHLSERIQQLASEGFEKGFLTKSEVAELFSKRDLAKETIKDFQNNNPATISHK